jgi:Ca-activated chloride channel homolog
MISSDDPKLTAYALGELQGQECAAVEEALRDDPVARAAVDEIRAMASRVASALVHEAASEERDDAESTSSDATASSASRAAIIHGRDPSKLDGGPLFDYTHERPKILRFPQLYFLIGGVAAACVGLLVSLTSVKPPMVTQYQVVHLNPPHSVPMQLPTTGLAAVDGAGADLTAAGAERIAPKTNATGTDRGGSSRQVVTTPVTPETFAAESHAFYRDNPFVTAASARWSTFGLDVDTTSYSVVRRFISSGSLPPAGVVRIEELLNYFSAAATSSSLANQSEPLAAKAEVAAAPWAPTHRLVRIALAGHEPPPTNRPRANLVFLIDVSGSMDAANKLPLVQQSMRILVDWLQPNDRVAIVTYAGKSGVLLPSTPASDIHAILAALDRLTPAGSTNGAVGLDIAYDIAKANFVEGGINRVVLCTDGDFNVGPTTEAALAHLVEEKASTGVTLTALGFGLAQPRDATLEMLADKGRGNHGYINTRRDADKLLAEQIGATLLAVARDVKVQVEFNPARVESYRLIGYEDRLFEPQAFADDAAPGAEIGAGQLVTAVYEIIPAVMHGDASSVAGTDALVTLRVRYKELAAAAMARQIDFAVKDEGTAFANASDDFKLAAAVAEYGMILRDSPQRGKASINDVIAWASSAQKRSADLLDYRNEFIDLARRTQTLLQ